MTCLSCGATTSNGLALCDICQRGAVIKLQYLPVYFGNLARWRRPARPNGSLGTSGQWLMQRGETEGSKIASALERAANDVDTWARVLEDDRGIDVPEGETDAETVTVICALLSDHLTSIATLGWGDQFLSDISRHERILRELTESVVPGWYAGACQRRVSMEATCGVQTYVVPGLTWVTCPGCGATTYARDHLEAVLDEARGWVARPKLLAETLVALVDSEQSVPRLYDRIRKWESLGWLVADRRLDADGDPVGPKRYRLGEVLDLALGKADAPTRPMRMTSA